jgi:hypothetical protein
MRTIILALLVAGLFVRGYSQTGVVQQINNTVNNDVALGPLRFLASDELMGRSPRRPEIDIAANYIAGQFQSFGLEKANGQDDYFQSFTLTSITPAGNGSLAVGNRSFNIGSEMLQVSASDISIEAPLLFAGYGTDADVANLNLTGKIVFAYFGITDSSGFREGLANTRSKASLLAKKGAVALVEIFRQKDADWKWLQAYLGRERTSLGDYPVPVLLLNSGDPAFAASLKDAGTTKIFTSGNKVRAIPAKNVMGMVRGTDLKLKNEYVVLSAHYDHLGVAPDPQEVNGRKDSIYNGARDNAIGVTAVVNAARFFAKYPPRRSLLFILYTAEEMGLLGSRYFAEHPVLPLNKIVYNLNCDNGGYNDTSIITIIGLGRTSADDDMRKACEAYDVKATADPVPELDLFDRSDNLNLAMKGIPAPTFGMGVTGFDSIIRKYYHQLSDEVESFDLKYALTYIRAYVLAAKNIADNPARPMWIKNDKYEAAWKKLYR